MSQPTSSISIQQVANLMGTAVLQGDLNLLQALVNSVLPLFDQADQDKCISTMCAKSLSSKNQEVIDYCEQFKAVTSKTALTLFSHVASNGYDGITDESLEKAFKAIGEHTLAAISSLWSYRDDTFGSRDKIKEMSAGQHSDWIIRLADKYMAEGKHFSNDRLTVSSRMNLHVSNKAHHKLMTLVQFMKEQFGVRVPSGMSDLYTEQSGRRYFGSDLQLTSSFIPRVENGLLERPELYFAMLDVAFMGDIPVLIKNDDELLISPSSPLKPFTGQIKICDSPKIITDKHDNLHCSSISFSSDGITSPFLSSVFDTATTTSVSLPAGYSLIMVKPDLLSEIGMKDVDEQKLIHCKEVLGTSWFNPHLNSSKAWRPSSASISLSDFMRALEESDFRNEFRAGSFFSDVTLINVANALACREIEVAKTTQYSDYSFRMNSICLLKEEFGIQPTFGTVFASSDEDVDSLFRANIKFDSDFTLHHKLPKAVMSKLSQESFRKLNDIGALGCIIDVHTDIDKAMALARRKWDFAHTATLRNFDIHSLMAIAKAPSDYSLFLAAHPEHEAIIVPHLPSSEKRQVLTDSLGL